MRPSQLTFDDLLGTIRKTEGMRLAAANTHAEWAAQCDAAIAQLAATGRPFMASDLRHLVTEPDHPNRWGPRLLAASHAGLIRPIGYGPSGRPTTHRSAARMWQGAGRNTYEG